MDALKQLLMLGGARVVAPLLPKVAVPRATDKQLRAGYTEEEISMAYTKLMTGPKATRPRWKTLRRTIIQMNNGIVAMGSGRNIPYKRRTA